MEHKFYFDLAAFVILLVVIEYHMRRNRERSGKNRLFLFLALFSIFAAVFSMGDSVHKAIGYSNDIQMYAVRMIEYIFYDLAAPGYVFYLLFMANMQHKLRYHIKFIVATLIPLALALLSVLGLFFVLIIETGNDAVVTGVLEYYRIQFLVIGLLYAMVGVALYIRFKYLINVQKNHIIIVPIIVLSISIIWSYIDANNHSVLFAAAICFLLLIMYDTSMEGTVDIETGFKTVDEFENTIKVNKIVGRKGIIISIILLNYRDALQRSGYDDIRSAIRDIADCISSTLNRSKVLSYTCFYDSNGSFSVEIPEKYEEAGMLFADNVAHNISNTGAIGETDLFLMANVCSIRFPEDAEDLDTILMISEDVRMMQHRLKVLPASEFTDTKEFEIRKQMVIIIDRAINKGYFEVYYQPIYNVKKQKFVSAEALIRLKDPEYGFISPGVFIPLAEKTGAIHKIGSFVLEEVCRFIGSEEFNNLGVEYIEINLSTAQCLRVDLIDEIKALTQKYGVNPSQLNMEITETAACYSQERLLNNIRVIHSEGYSFSLDDFGTGYSNLLRMAVLPIDIVKFDKAFVDMDVDDKFHIVITDTVRLLKRMGLKILVEGIETREMVGKFIANDVEYIQGYYYSKPLPMADYIEFVKKNNNSVNAGKNE